MKIEGKIVKKLESTGTYRNKVTGQSVSFKSTRALVDVGGELLEVFITKSDSSPVPVKICATGADFSFTLNPFKIPRSAKKERNK